jgi:extradiol dioxygenase family protein
MLKNSPFFAGFAVDDLAAARRFYAETLGVFPVVEVATSRRSTPS